MESFDHGIQTMLLVAFLLAGLWAYERWGLRLGGVLVLPMLTLYSLNDPRLAVIFASSAAITYIVGELMHRHTLLYGRRALTVFLVASAIATWASATILGITLPGIILPILPGLFAFNLHREGRPLRGIVIFGAWLAAFLVAGYGAGAGAMQLSNAQLTAIAAVAAAVVAIAIPIRLLTSRSVRVR